MLAATIDGRASNVRNHLVNPVSGLGRRGRSRLERYAAITTAQRLFLVWDTRHLEAVLLDITSSLLEMQDGDALRREVLVNPVFGREARAAAPALRLKSRTRRSTARTFCQSALPVGLT